MLSRVAERVYWMSRYLERVENTARIVDVYGKLLLDLPEEARLGWDVVFGILGVGEEFEAVAGGGTETETDEAAAVSMLLVDQSRPFSVLSALSAARENARTTRDIVPMEAWRTINEVHMYARDRLPSARERSDVLVEIVVRCHQVCGILDGTMSHGPAYQFVRLGRNLERADMISRMIDVAAAVLMSDRHELRPFDDALWSVTLRSLSAYQMYRQYTRRRVVGEDVIAFLLQDRDFPRSIVHCMDRMSQALQLLPESAMARKALDSFATRVAGLDSRALDPAQIHEEIDRFQIELAGLNDVIRTSWLDPSSPI